MSAAIANTQLRERLVAEAQSWLRTPFHDNARVKGAGVDCANLLVACYKAAGLVPSEWEPPAYAPQWHLHRSEEKFLDSLLGLGARRTESPLAGDVAMFRYGRTNSHGAIVIEWPVIIHAYAGDGCVTLADASLSPLASRFAAAYTLLDEAP